MCRRGAAGIAEEAARIQSLRRSHHRTTKQPKMELLSPVGAAGQGKATAATVGKKPGAARRTGSNQSPQGGVTPRLRSPLQEVASGSVMFRLSSGGS